MSSERAQAPDKASSEALVARFAFDRLLNQDQAGRRLSLLGQINGQQAILLVERAAFSNEHGFLNTLPQTLARVDNLGANDIYAWFLAWSKQSDVVDKASTLPPDLKLNLIYPCTTKHISKYSVQGLRTVTETPQIYRQHVRPYMQAQREAGRLNWVFNIIDGKTEQEDVIFRAHSRNETADADQEGFLLLPDLNWDRKTLTSLHLLGLVERRDIWSVRDLKKKHVPWLRSMRLKLISAATSLYPSIEEDQMKLYVHYQPTYYHFHIHVVHIMLEPGATQATGKALGLENVISQLETMGDEEAGMDQASLTYTLGEASDLWKDVFEPLKKTKA